MIGLDCINIFLQTETKILPFWKLTSENLVWLHKQTSQNPTFYDSERVTKGELRKEMLKDVISINAKVDGKNGTIKGS